MVIGIMGENCSGKSTLAEEIRKTFDAEVVTGKDYLRMAKSESEAEAVFREKLRRAMTEGNVIYVISEPEQLRFLPDGSVRIRVNADLETIKERFSARMHGHLPDPVARMLENRHGSFDREPADLEYDGVSGDPPSLCDMLRERI